MLKGLKIGFSISLSVFFILNFVEYWFSWDWSISLLSFFGLISLLFALTLLRFMEMLLPLLLVTASLIICFFSEYGFYQILWLGIIQMRTLVIMVLMVPIVSWVLRKEPYIESLLNSGIKILNSTKRLYIGLMALTQVVSYFLMVSSVLLTYQIIDSFLKNNRCKIWEIYKGTGIMRGVSLTSLWVLSIPNFAYAVHVFGSSLILTILQGFFISIIGITIASFLFLKEEKKYDINIFEKVTEEIQFSTVTKKKEMEIQKNTIEFFILILTLFGAIIINYEFLSWQLLIVIPFTILLWTIVYFLIKKDLTFFFSELKKYVLGGVSMKAQEISIFFAAGIFIFSLNSSGYGMEIINRIFIISDIFSWFNMLWYLPIIVWVAGLCGLSPLAAMVFIGELLKDVQLPYAPEFIVLSLTIGSLLSATLSPISMPSIMLSSISQQNKWKVSIAQNWKFSLLCYLFAELYMQTMVLLLY